MRAFLFSALVCAPQAFAFTAGNVVVVRILSSGSAGAQPVFLDEYTPAGVLVQSVAMPTAVSGANKPLTIEGGHTAGGLMTRSVYKEYLVLTGYAATPGTAVAGSASATINRTVARVAADNLVDTSTVLTDFADGGEPRGAAALWADGADERGFWVSGTTSTHLDWVRSVTYGATRSESLDFTDSVTDVRGVAIGGVELFVSAKKINPGNFFLVGRIYIGALPFHCCATGTNLLNPPGQFGFNPWQFLFVDRNPDVPGLDTLYVADDFKGIEKFGLISGTWTYLDNIALPGAIGLTGSYDGTKTTLFVSTAGALYKFVDLYDYNQNLSNNYPDDTPVFLADAPVGSAFSGVALAPDPPHVVSIARATSSPTKASSVSFNVTFSEPVTGVDPSDFARTTTGISGSSISNVTGSGSSYVVTVATGTGDGTVRLDLVDDDSISNAPPASIRLGGSRTGNGNFTTGEVYTIDKTPPTVTSINRAGPNPTFLSSVDFTVTFSEPVVGVDATDFALAGTLSGASITNVTGSGATRTVSVNTSSGNGTVQLNLVNDGTITDLVTNVLTGTFTGQTYTIDHTVPVVSSITAADSNPSKTNAVHFTVTFSAPVSGVDATDFALASTGLGSPQITNVTTANNTVYTVTTSSTGSGTLRLDLIDDDSILALSTGAPLGGFGTGNGSFTSGAVYTIDTTAPAVLSSVRNGTNPTPGPTAAFTVAFSESVTGVDSSDFAISASGLTGASITNVAVSSSSAVVTVYVGTGVGTLRLDVVDNGSITDVAGNHLAGGFTTGETYNVNPPPLVVISQIYGSGNASGATYGNDYIEIFNRNTSPVSLSGWSVQYASATSSTWAVTALPAVTLQPGTYLLIQEGGNAISPLLPAPDASGTIDLSPASGKIALVDNSTPLAISDPHASSDVIDFVGYGPANASETSPAPAPSGNTATIRTPSCRDTDNNSADFQAGAPNPHNSASSAASCVSQLPAAPTGVVANATTSTSVTVSWTTVGAAQAYEVLRTGGGSTRAFLGSIAAPPFVDNMAIASTAYLYYVRTVDASANRSFNSAAAFTSTFVFTDSPLVAGNVIRAVHITELRAAINQVRGLAQLAPTTFTDSSLSGVLIRKVHIDELRASLDEARAMLQLSAVTYSETISANTTTVKAAHIVQLRNGTK